MENYDDEELLYLSRCGHEKAQELLLDLYYSKVKQWVYPYYKSRVLNSLYDYEDLIQIGMEIMLKSLDSYRDDAGATLYTYAKIVVVRKMNTLVTSAKAKKNTHDHIVIPLDGYVNGDMSGCRYDEMVEDPSEVYRPEKRLVIKETTASYTFELKQRTSSIENRVLTLLGEGYSQKEIAILLDISIKSVYNAAYRAHQKLEPLTRKNKCDKL